ncbi:MAG: biotin/lipoyl-binding protein [Acidimicrobiaceae bacterium]|nr:biotin/lipoyl-binding protein [Acidimicrobiaceae bacterium]
MEVRFPALSHKDPAVEGVLATWFVSDGQTVEKGQLIAEVQVDKVSAEVEAPASGRIRLLVKEQDVVQQESPIAQVD